jgi:hypothetical protein
MLLIWFYFSVRFLYFLMKKYRCLYKVKCSSGGVDLILFDVASLVDSDEVDLYFFNAPLLH